MRAVQPAAALFCNTLNRYIKKYARIYNDIPYYVITTELVHTALLVQFIVYYVKHYKCVRAMLLAC